LVAATPKELRKIPRKKLSIIIGASSCEALLFRND
jgi:hypothetical protein